MNKFAFLLILTVFSNVVFAYPFLTKSKILKEFGLKIMIGEIQNDAIVFDKDVLKKNNVFANGSNSFLITSSGIKPLKDKTFSRNLTRVCGDPYPGIGFPKEGQDGFLILAGNNVQNIFKWYPAKKANNKTIPSYLKSIISDTLEETSIYFPDILNKMVYQVRWERYLTENDIKKFCKGMAEWNVKIDPKKSYSALYESCIKNKEYCEKETRLIVGLKDDRDSCIEITNSVIDCDGQAIKGFNLREFLGTLTIKVGLKEETWLIWNAPGTEGDGIYGIEIHDVGKKVKPTEEWLVYNGC